MTDPNPPLTEARVRELMAMAEKARGSWYEALTTPIALGASMHMTKLDPALRNAIPPLCEALLSAWEERDVAQATLVLTVAPAHEYCQEHGAGHAGEPVVEIVVREAEQLMRERDAAIEALRPFIEWAQWGSGDYWDRHRVSKRARPEKPAGVQRAFTFAEISDWTHFR